MKELKEISWLVDEPTYRADSAISFSTLSKFYREGFSSLNKLYDKIETPSLTFGSMVDSLITGGIEEFNERFALIQDFGISDSLRQITKTLYDTYKEFYASLDDIPNNILSDVAENCGYYVGPKYYNARVKKVRECAQYYEALNKMEGKTPITQQQYNDAFDCVRILKTSPTTETLFAEDTDNLKHYYQLKFKGEYEGIDLRCMADLVILDYENKVIYPYDLKTSGHPEWEFPKSFVCWNYYWQAQIYWYLIRQNLDKDEYFKDFKLEDYQFIVISNATRTPLLWKFEGTKATGECYYRDYTLPSWRSAIKELDYYLNEEPRVPIGISVTEPNSIKEWLEKGILLN